MNNTDPIFRAIFGNQWDSLPPVMHKHYANRPHSNDVVTVEGVMKVGLSVFARFLSPILRLSGTLVPYAGENIPITVHFRSELESSSYCFDRIFHFPDKKPYYFRSRMVPVGGNEVVEFMPIGIGWHARYRYDGNKILIEHCGYKMEWFGKMIRLPLEWFLGKGHAEEVAIGDNNFRMVMDIRHPLLGKIYAYSGEFTVMDMALDP